MYNYTNEKEELCVQTHYQLIQFHGLCGIDTNVKNDSLTIFTDNKKKNMTINWTKIKTHLSPSKIYAEQNEKMRGLSWFMRIVSRSQIQENNDQKQ